MTLWDLLRDSMTISEDALVCPSAAVVLDQNDAQGKKWLMNKFEDASGRVFTKWFNMSFGLYGNTATFGSEAHKLDIHPALLDRERYVRCRLKLASGASRACEVALDINLYPD